MTCDGCSNAVKRVLGKLGDQVTNMDVSWEKKLVTVTTDLPPEKILETLEKTGKQVSLLK